MESNEEVEVNEITPEEFVKTWQSAKSPLEARKNFEELGMKWNVAKVRSTCLRKRGIPLFCFRWVPKYSAERIEALKKLALSFTNGHQSKARR